MNSFLNTSLKPLTINLAKGLQVVPLMILVSFVINEQVTAQSIVYDHTADAEWSWWVQDDPFSQPYLEFGSDNVNSTSAGTSVKNFSVTGTVSTFVESTMSVGSDGKIRSYNTIRSDSPFAGDDSFQSLSVNSKNLITVHDQISAFDDPDASYAVFLAQVDGPITHEGRTVGPGEPWVGLMETQSTLDVFGQGATGSDIFKWETTRLENEYFPIINEQYPVFETALMILTLDPNAPVDFTLSYEEQVKIAIDNLDALGFYLESTNNFFNTFELFANVYDVNGNLLEGVQVTSALGHTYGNFSPVPEPASTVMISFLAAGVMLRRRR